MPIFFADDSNLFQDGESLEIENILNRELNEIVKWLKVDKLTLNVDKFNGCCSPDKNVIQS